MTTTPSYTDEQVLAIAQEIGMSPSRTGVKCKAIASLLEYMVQERQRLQAEVDDTTVASFVEKTACIISGAPFPSSRSYAKAREISDLALNLYRHSAKQNETKEAKS
jgi:hypothetical protein